MRSGPLALLGLVAAVVGWALFEAAPGMPLAAWGLVALGVALMVAALVIDRRGVGSALTSGRGRFGVGATVAVSLTLGLVLAVNAVSARLYHRLDLTGLSQFTLTSQTRNLLADLAAPVEVKLVFSPRVPPAISRYARDLLDEYRLHTDALAVTEVDPDLDPEQARRYGVDRRGALLGTVVFVGPAGYRAIPGPAVVAEAEHAFTAAILEVTGTRQKTIHVLAGHGEAGIGGDYSEAAAALRTNLFRVETLDLAAGVPDDAAALVIAGPRRDFDEDEIGALSAFLSDAGRLLVMFDPNPPHTVRQLLAAWLTIDDGTVIDPDSNVAPTRHIPLVPEERNAFGLAEIYFPGAASVRPKSSLSADSEVVPLAWTSPASYLAPTISSDADTVVGSRAIGALITAGEARIAVIGDADFAGNSHFHNGGNGDMLLAAIGWLTADQTIVSIDRRLLPNRRLIVSGGEARFINFASFGLLPLVVLAIGGAVWWRRR